MLKFLPYAAMSSISFIVIWVLWGVLLRPQFHDFSRALKSTLLMGLTFIILANVPMWAIAIEAPDSVFQLLSFAGIILTLVWGAVSVGFALFDATH